MDGQEYLSQISADVRPAKAPSGINGILHSKFFIVGAIGVVALIIILIIGALLGGGDNTNNERSKSTALQLHVENTAAIIKEYQTHVKSSSLRSSLASLNSVLMNTNTSLENYIAEKYIDKDKNSNKKIVADADAAKEKLETDLFEAKINGLLDRTMAHKMAYEVSMLMNEELSLYNMTKNETLRNILDDSYGSLETLYDKFDNFKEGQ